MKVIRRERQPSEPTFGGRGVVKPAWQATRRAVLYVQRGVAQKQPVVVPQTSGTQGDKAKGDT
jgi:hypothetical protein